MAPARTGRDSKSKIVVRNTDHTKRGMRSIVIPLLRMLITVVIKLTDPKMEETPARWSEKIPMSTEAPAWAIPAARGG